MDPLKPGTEYDFKYSTINGGHVAVRATFDELIRGSKSSYLSFRNATLLDTFFAGFAINKDDGFDFVPTYSDLDE